MNCLWKYPDYGGLQVHMLVQQQCAASMPLTVNRKLFVCCYFAALDQTLSTEQREQDLQYATWFGKSQRPAAVSGRPC